MRDLNAYHIVADKEYFKNHINDDIKIKAALLLEYDKQINEAKDIINNLPENVRETILSELHRERVRTIRNTNNKWKLENKNNKKYKYLFKSINGEAIYRILIEGKFYVCVHKGPLFTCLKYHLERGFRDYHNTIKHSNTVVGAFGINQTYTVDKFFSNGGEIELLQSNIVNNKSVKDKCEYYWIDETYERFGEDKLHNVINKHSKFHQKNLAT